MPSARLRARLERERISMGGACLLLRLEARVGGSDGAPRRCAQDYAEGLQYNTCHGGRQRPPHSGLPGRASQGAEICICDPFEMAHIKLSRLWDTTGVWSMQSLLKSLRVPLTPVTSSAVAIWRCVSQAHSTSMLVRLVTSCLHELSVSAVAADFFVLFICWV